MFSKIWEFEKKKKIIAKLLFPNGPNVPLSDLTYDEKTAIEGLMNLSDTGEKKTKRRKPKKPKKPKKPILNQPFPLDVDLVDLGEYKLKPTEIVISSTQTVKNVPTPPILTDTLPFAIIGVFLIYTLKKLSGLDRKLKHGSCEIKHQQAITRIAKLEGKVLRKQVIDGGKKLKAKLDERKKEKGDE